jgi:hypothetical protein
MTREEALAKIKKTMLASGGYYRWMPLAEGDEWLLRIPIVSEETETWMKGEKNEIVHICDPAAFANAIISEEKDELSRYSGYVNTPVEPAGLACNNCKVHLFEEK